MLRRLSIGFLFVLASCGTARLVQQTQYGGIIALQGDRGKAMEDASRMMSQHCGANNFSVVQQGEEVIGTDTSYGERTDSASNNSGTASASETNGGTSTRNATEWRVHYQCNGAPGPGPSPEGGGAPPPPPPPAPY
jgi:hypothetical protein